METFQAVFFGSFELSRGDRRLENPQSRSRQATKLLAYIIYHAGAPIPAEKLIDFLWPGTVEDPAHALTNLIYRVRKLLAEVWPGENLIQSRQGAYQWNPEVPIETDVGRFERCAAAAPETATLQEMVACYRGKFLETYTDDLSVLARQTYYHNAYLGAIYRLIEQYDAARDYGAMERLCQRGLETDPMEERLHCGVLRAYIGENRLSAAEQYYQETTERLRRYLGNVPLEELAGIYQRMQEQIHTREVDLDRILADMAEQQRKRQAFFCDYGFFQKMFILQHRLKERADIPVSVVLISLYRDGAGLAGTAAGEAMERLKETLLSSLRYGDVIAPYSASQYLLMLSGCPEEMVPRVMERVFRKFYDSYKFSPMQLQYSERALF